MVREEMHKIPETVNDLINILEECPKNYLVAIDFNGEEYHSLSVVEDRECGVISICKY